MASIHRKTRSPFWHCAFYMPDGRRTLRSTGTSDRRKARQICMEWEKATRDAKEGRLTETQARKIISDIYAIGNNAHLPSATVKDHLAAWLAAKRLEIAESSFLDYAKAVDVLTVQLGAKATKPMDAITAGDILAFRGDLSKRVRGVTVNKYLKILQGAWTMALKAGVVRENVFVRVGLVKAGPKQARRAFTLPELKRILADCDDEWRGMVLLGVYTGQRLSDIAGMTWQQVDLDSKEVRLTTGKTGRVMCIPMAATLARHLMAMESADDAEAPLFPNAFEMLKVNQTNLSRQFTDILARVGLVERKTHEGRGIGRDARRTSGGLSFHCLRHTATSLLKNAGVSDVVAREIIGHDSEAVSRQYTHIESATLRKAIAALPDLLSQEAT